MLCLYFCWTALLTVSAHEAGRHKATEGGKSNTEAPHGLPGGRHTLGPWVTTVLTKSYALGTVPPDNDKSQARHNNHQTCDVDEFRRQRWGDDDPARCNLTERHSSCVNTTQAAYAKRAYAGFLFAKKVIKPR